MSAEAQKIDAPWQTDVLSFLRLCFLLSLFLSLFLTFSLSLSLSPSNFKQALLSLGQLEG